MLLYLKPSARPIHAHCWKRSMRVSEHPCFANRMIRWSHWAQTSTMSCLPALIDRRSWFTMEWNVLRTIGVPCLRCDLKTAMMFLLLPAVFNKVFLVVRKPFHQLTGFPRTPMVAWAGICKRVLHLYRECGSRAPRALVATKRSQRKVFCNWK